MSSESLNSSRTSEMKSHLQTTKRSVNPQLNRIKLSRQVFKDNASVRSSRRGDGSIYAGSRRGGVEDRSSTDTYLGGPSRKNRQPGVENTYKLEPDRLFPFEKAERIMMASLDEHLNGAVYDTQTVGTLSRTLADTIKDKVKALNIPRFKIVSYVMICEQKQSSVRVASRGLWDTQFDTHASASFENGSLNAVALLYGIYQE